MPQVPTHCKPGPSMGIRYLPPPWFDSPFFKTCFNGRKLRYNSAEATTTWGVVLNGTRILERR
jgi:hypothetical protein